MGRKARPGDKVLLPPQHMQKQRNTEQARERAWASTKTSLRLNLDHTAPRTYRRRKRKEKNAKSEKKKKARLGKHSNFLTLSQEPTGSTEKEEKRRKIRSLKAKEQTSYQHRKKERFRK